MHALFNKYNIPPHEAFQWSEEHRRFAYASMLLAIEEEEKAHKQMMKGSG